MPTSPAPTPLAKRLPVKTNKFGSRWSILPSLRFGHIPSAKSDRRLPTLHQVLEPLMKLSSSRLALAAFAFAMPANAETTDPLWTLSTSGSWSEISSSDRDAVSASVSLSRQFGNASVGASIGTSNGSDALFDETEITDRSSVFGSVWTSFPIGAAYVDLSISLGQDDYDGDVFIEESRFDELNDSGVSLVSEVDTISVAAAVSRIYFAGDWDLIPNASLGWSESDSTTTAASLTDALSSPFSITLSPSIAPKHAAEPVTDRKERRRHLTPTDTSPISILPSTKRN